MRTYQRTAPTQLAIDRIVSRLHAASIGEIIPKEELETLARGSSIGYFGAVNAARRELLKRGVAFQTLRGQGFLRLAGFDAILNEGENGRTKIMRQARRSYRAVTNIADVANDLSPSELRRANQYQTTFDLIRHLSLKRTVESRPVEEEPVTTGRDRPQDNQGLRNLLRASGSDEII